MTADSDMEPKPRPRGSGARGPYRTSEARRDIILSAALDHFAHAGYEAASLRAIARDAGMSHASVLHHFGSKQELFLAVLRQQESMDMQLLASVNESKTLAGLTDALAAVVQRYLDEPAQGRLWPLLAASAAGKEGHPASTFVTDRYRSWTSEMTRFVDEAKAQGLIADDVDSRIAVDGHERLPEDGHEAARWRT